MASKALSEAAAELEAGTVATPELVRQAGRAYLQATKLAPTDAQRSWAASEKLTETANAHLASVGAARCAGACAISAGGSVKAFSNPSHGERGLIYQAVGFTRCAPSKHGNCYRYALIESGRTLSDRTIYRRRGSHAAARANGAVLARVPARQAWLWEGSPPGLRAEESVGTDVSDSTRGGDIAKSRSLERRPVAATELPYLVT